MKKNNPTYGTNFLLSFDYQLPPLPKKINKILYIHSTRMEQSEIALTRLAEMFQDAEILILKQKDVSFDGLNIKFTGVFDCPEKLIPSDYYLTTEGKV